MQKYVADTERVCSATIDCAEYILFSIHDVKVILTYYYDFIHSFRLLHLHIRDVYILKLKIHSLLEIRKHLER